MIRRSSPMVRFTCSLTACALALGANSAFGDVRILGSPGVAYPSIQDAIDAALSGDTLLLGQDSYEGFVIDGKGLTLIGPPNLPHTISGTVEVRNVPEGSTVNLDTLFIQGGLWQGSYYEFQNEDALILDQNAGAVRLYNCQLLGGSGPYDEYNESGYPAGGAGAVVTNSVNVAFLGCSVIGGNGAGNPTNEYDGYGGDGAAGLAAHGSAVALYDTDLDGGDGGSAGITGGAGGHGASFTGLGVFASGCAFSGGDGGDALDFIYVVPGDGGHGLSVELGTSARIVDNAYTGGASGYSVFGSGQTGLPKYWAGGTLDETPGTHRSLSIAESFVADGEPFQFQVTGVPGDRVFLALGNRPIFNFTTNPPGVRLVPFPKHTDWLSTVVIGASGAATIQLPTAELSGGEWRTRIAQIRALPAGGGAAYGGSVLLTHADNETTPDCNGNGQADLFDVMNGTEADCNGDLIPDSCTMTGDCNNNGIDDQLDVECGGATDLNGNLIPDVCEGAATVYVDAAALPGGDGSIGAPVNNLLEGIGLTLDGWSVEVAGGNYTGLANRNINFAGRSLHIYSPAGSGGCTIDLEDDGYAFTPGAANVTVELTGLTIKNGKADNFDAGALWSQLPTTFILRDCVFESCSANWGAGAVAGVGELDVADCVFLGNASPGDSGGAISFGGRARVTRTHFEDNESYRGGAFYHWGAVTEGLDLTHSTFVGNTASGFGGAISLHDGLHHVDNCLFDSNTVIETSSIGARGGAIHHLPIQTGTTSKLTITSSTLVNNDVGNSSGAFAGGGAIYVGRSSRTVLLNSVLWGNTGNLGSSIRLQGNSAGGSALLEIGFCDLEYGIAGIVVTDGSIVPASVLDLDPQFVNPAVGDFRLGAGSPCIDAGNDNYLEDDLFDQDGDGSMIDVVPVDLNGNPREVDDPGVADSGVGSAPLSDLGAYERQ